MFLIGFILLLLIEELFLGCLHLRWSDHYSETIYVPIHVPINTHRKPNETKIAIVSVVYNNSNSQEYELAENTVKCYATLHKYTYIKLNLESEKNLLKSCPGKDFMFQRHCVISNLMKENEDTIDWILFIDSDIGVVNPNHLIEEYIDEDADIILYDRLYNYEITAGTYIVKNNEFARTFLLNWSQYEYKVQPNSFQASVTDNAAIHEVILDEFCNDCHLNIRQHCTKLWKKMKNYNELFVYESCARSLLGIRDVYESKSGTLQQRSISNRWARDGWQTHSRWSTDDFMFHGWKKSQLNGFRFGSWISPLR
ncbi:hypothetical protein M3Y97_00943800 [Aphelenchoides bicaudatus]|nr:hypothetical protein M3Y97_00943800 [Aphelenchoides bicaudatus]